MSALPTRLFVPLRGLPLALVAVCIPAVLTVQATAVLTAQASTATELSSRVAPDPEGAVEARTTAVPVGRVEAREIVARSLQGNLLGDDPRKRVLVYLPPGYDTVRPDRRYPVVYLLHGIFDDPEVWTEHFDVPVVLDALIAEGRMPPAIVVMPHGSNRLGGGFYRNSPVSGRWADFIARELVAFTDSAYRTLPHRASRAVVGHSMGGYGALHLGMTRADVFGVAYGMSPCCLAAEEDLGQGNPAWIDARQLQDPAELEGAIERGQFYVVAVMGVLASFLPDPDDPPFYVDHPFREARGETLPDEPAHTRFLHAFPIHRVDDHRQALLSLRGLGLDYGTGEQFPHIPEGTRLLSERLSELRIPHTFEAYRGDHRRRITERLREVVFPWVDRHLDAGLAP